MKEMNEDSYIRVACRLCGNIMLFPKSLYKESDFKDGWECRGTLSKSCELAYKRDKENWSTRYDDVR